jgi:hypothetical protein
MKITLLIALGMLGLLMSCTINPHPMDMTRAVQNAKTAADHDALARHYDDAANEMQAKVEEHKKLLTYYQPQKTRNKQAQDLANHCQGLIRIYEQAAAENRAMAKSHREMAAETK